MAGRSGTTARCSTPFGHHPPVPSWLSQQIPRGTPNPIHLHLVEVHQHSIQEGSDVLVCHHLSGQSPGAPGALEDQRGKSNWKLQVKSFGKIHHSFYLEIDWKLLWSCETETWTAQMANLPRCFGTEVPHQHHLQKSGLGVRRVWSFKRSASSIDGHGF